MDLTETFIRGELVFEGKLLRIHRDTVSLADGRREVREVIRHSGAAVIVPRLPDGRYVMVRQYRYALGRTTLEFPAGRLHRGEDPLVCARRELAEETGYQARSWKQLFTIHPAPGYCDELLWIYLAEDLASGSGHPDHDEQVLTLTANFAELFDLFESGRITDAKTVAALLYLKAYQL